MGYENIKIYNGGIKDWQKSGYEIITIDPLPKYEFELIDVDALLDKIKQAELSNCIDENGKPILTIIDYRTENLIRHEKPVPTFKTSKHSQGAAYYGRGRASMRTATLQAAGNTADAAVPWKQLGTICEKRKQLKPISIKKRLYIVIAFVVLLLSIVSANIYFYGIIEFSNNRLKRTIDLERTLSDILLKEIVLSSNHSDFEYLKNRYSDLRKEFVKYLSDIEDALLYKRQQYLEKRFSIIKDTILMNNNVDILFSELIDSIRYIHEHHIVYLKNAINHNVARLESNIDNNFEKHHDQSASEVDIIKVASSIQTSLFDIFLILKETGKSRNPMVFKDKFLRRMEHLITLTNTFESYSLDAQDGILVEELLSTIRQCKRAFSRLLAIESDRLVLSGKLDKNKDILLDLFKLKRDHVKISNSKMRNRVGFLQLLSIFLTIFIVSFIIFLGKKMMNEVSRAVKQTEKIRKDLSYSVQIDKNTSHESRILFDTLNSMTKTIRGQIKQLRESEAQYQSLFLDSPISLWVEDFSEVKALLDQWRSSGVTDFHQYFSKNPEAVAAAAAAARIIEVNQASLGIYQAHSKDELIGSLEKIILPEQYDVLAGEFAALAEGKRFFHAELDNLTLRGEKISVRISLLVPPGYENTLEKVYVSILDITDRVKAERALKRAKEYAENILKLVPSAVFAVDHHKRVTSWNHQASVLTGYSEEEIIGKKCSAFSLAPCGVQCGLLSHDFAKPIIGAECTMRTKDGRIRYISKNVDVLRDDFGNVVGGIESFEDITERKIAEEKLKKLTQAVEQSPVTVVITDINGTIEYVNPKFEKITGYTASEVLRRTPRVLKSDAHPPEFYRNMWETISSGSDWYGEILNKRKDGSLYWESASISPIFDDRGNITHYVAAKEDITDRKKTEVELQKAKENAEAATRAKSCFLANMSHEIRTPMNSILGFLELVLEDSSLSETQRKHLTTAQISANGLLGLINDILDISKLESGKLSLEMRPFNLIRLLGEIRDTMLIGAREKDLDLYLDGHTDA